MKKTIGILTLVGLSSTAAAHTSASGVGLHMVDHVLPVVLCLMVVGVAVKKFGKR